LPASVDPEGRATRRNCPRCAAEALVARLQADVLLDECPRCLGVYLDLATLERVLAGLHRLPVHAALGMQPVAARVQPLHRGEVLTYVKCPDCGSIMNRRNFGRQSGVIVDVCSAHGTWFDADELPRVCDFVRRGGLVNPGITARLTAPIPGSAAPDKSDEPSGPGGGTSTHGDTLFDFLVAAARKVFLD
jgi:Zn-finger nucleic acid-binding protein